MRGHITKRSKGSWSIVLDLGRDPSTGKRKQQWVSLKEPRSRLSKSWLSCSTRWTKVIT